MTAKVEVVEVTPDMATTWIATRSYEHQRPPNMKHVQFLSGEMERGVFKQDTVIEFAQLGQETLLTDGQHRLFAVAHCRKPQRFVIVTRDAQNAEEVALDYTRTDQGKRRTVSQNYKTLDLEGELGFTYTWINALGSAVAFINDDWNRVRQGRLHSNDRLQAMRDYAPALDYYIEATAGKGNDIKSSIERAATVSIGLVTFRYSAAVYGHDRIDQFWNGVASDDGLAKNDPRKAAWKHLLEVRMTGGAATGNKKIATPAYSSRYLANCFNAWIKGETRNFARVYDATKPMIILGSPFTGK